jgi:hypothetical protein
VIRLSATDNRQVRAELFLLFSQSSNYEQNSPLKRAHAVRLQRQGNAPAGTGIRFWLHSRHHSAHIGVAVLL